MTNSDERKAANRAKGIRAMKVGVVLMAAGCMIPVIAVMAIVAILLLAPVAKP